jgi:hypothetical protein
MKIKSMEKLWKFYRLVVPQKKNAKNVKLQGEKYKHKDCLSKLLSKNVDEYINGLKKEKCGTGQDQDPRVMQVLRVLFNEQHDSYIAQILYMNNDTVAHDNKDRYLRIASGLGFSQVNEFPFMGFDGSDITREYLYVLWSKQSGIFLKVETMNNASRVAKATCYYNWQPHGQPDYIPGVLGDGHYDYTNKATWIGENDVTEALRYKLVCLGDHGDFVTPWVKSPYISFKTYAEKKVDDGIADQRISHLPKSMQELMQKK